MLEARGILEVITQDLPEGEVGKEGRMILTLIEWPRTCKERISCVWNSAIQE